ncbi:hypothetical protein L227DRAFT_514196, partial [Lentinus tigrinus ALCF2SS1-6]
GVNPAPCATLDIPIIRTLVDRASHASLRDTSSYGSGLRKFHIFCDVFSIPESDRLPASFQLLHLFALWAAAEPDASDAAFYLSAVRAWHLAQGWPPPLSDDEFSQLNWSLRGLANMQAGKRTRPPHPPITLAMLSFLPAVLWHDNPFDACIWAITTCAFFGMMHFGEVTVRACKDFSPAKHLT